MLQHYKKAQRSIMIHYFLSQAGFGTSQFGDCQALKIKRYINIKNLFTTFSLKIIICF